MHGQAEVGVGVFYGDKKLKRVNIQMQFFLNLANERIFRRLVGFNLAAGEFPFFRNVLVFIDPTLNTQVFFIVFDDRCNHCDVFHE